MTFSEKATEPRVLVLGATGNFGGAAVQALLTRGWRVRAMARATTPTQVASGLDGVEWVAGDAMRASDVVRAAQGVSFIVHAVNPPGYRRWRELALPMLESSVQAARQSGARLVLPGNVYNFSPGAGPLLHEGSPQHPETRKGQVRVEMEQRLWQAGAEGVRSLVLRAGDFFGGQRASSWFNTLWVKPGRRVSRRVVYPGVHDVGHAWAYLPDLADALVRVMALDAQEPGRLSVCEHLHFGGHWLAHGVEMADAVRRTWGRPDLPIKGVPWPLLRLGTPFVPVLREVLEMRYLWQVPMQLDNRKLCALIGREPHTPFDQAVRASLGLQTPVEVVARRASARWSL